MKIASPLTGKYLAKNPILYIFLKFIDFITSCFFISKKTRVINNPKKILISNIAHLGDVVISSSVLPLIKEKFPNCRIGFLCSKPSREILKNHPLIYKIHTLDHWKLNRSDSSFINKIFEYLISRAKALKEIKKEKYDAAIDLYSHFPNTIYLLWQSGIKTRIGYTSGGYGNFLTMRLDWKNQDRHMSQYHFDLIKLLGIEEKKSGGIIVDAELFAGKKPDVCLPEKYILFHIGAGDIKKMWDIGKWKQLTKSSDEKGYNIVFTGRGVIESKQILEIIDYQKKYLNLCDKLDLQEMIYVIKNAEFIVCVDSVVSHIAASLNKPAAVIFCGINNHHHWISNNKNIFPFIKPLPCCPCYDKNGCETMDCLNDIKFEEVLAVMEKTLEKAD